MQNPELIPIIVAFVAAVPGILALRANSRKAGGDAYAALTNALRTSGQTLDDVFKMLGDVPALRAQLDDMQDELEDLRLGVGILTAQLVKKGLTPEWKPKPRRKASEAKTIQGFGVRNND